MEEGKRNKKKNLTCGISSRLILILVSFFEIFLPVKTQIGSYASHSRPLHEGRWQHARAPLCSWMHEEAHCCFAAVLLINSWWRYALHL